MKFPSLFRLIFSKGIIAIFHLPSSRPPRPHICLKHLFSVERSSLISERFTRGYVCAFTNIGLLKILSRFTPELNRASRPKSKNHIRFLGAFLLKPPTALFHTIILYLGAIQLDTLFNFPRPESFSLFHRHFLV